MTKLSMIEFYIAKIESYMRRKHDSILKVQEDEDSFSPVQVGGLSDTEQVDDDAGDANSSDEAVNERNTGDGMPEVLVENNGTHPQDKS